MAWLSPFATFLIVCPTSFFLGLLFSLFPYDYPLLWSGTPAPASHFALYEQHLSFLYTAPALITRLLHIMIFLGLFGLVAKLYKPTESNMLFDGGSLVLYMCAVIVYGTNVVKGIRTVHFGDYGSEMVPGEADLRAGKPLDVVAGISKDTSMIESDLLGREDTMRVLAASNTILALVLVGVLALQAGQWYAEKAQRQEEDKMDADDKAKGKDTPTTKKTVKREASGSKKKAQ